MTDFIFPLPKKKEEEYKPQYLELEEYIPELPKKKEEKDIPGIEIIQIL